MACYGYRPACRTRRRAFPPTVLMRCTVVTFESRPLPRREATSSLSRRCRLPSRRACWRQPGRPPRCRRPAARSGRQNGGRQSCRSNERCDRLPESPGQLAVGASLAFVDLHALGMRREHDGLARRSQGLGNGRLGGRGAHREPERRSKASIALFGNGMAHFPNLSALRGATCPPLAQRAKAEATKQSRTVVSVVRIASRSPTSGAHSRDPLARDHGLDNFPFALLCRRRLGQVFRDLVEESRWSTASAGRGQPAMRDPWS